MKRFILSLSITIAVFFSFVYPVKAVCPLCTIAVGAGLGFSRWMGVDDVVIGIWIGGLILSSGLWLADWIKKKELRIPYKKTISILLSFIFIALPLYWGKIIGATNNSLWGVDKILLGIIIGAAAFIMGVKTDRFLRKINNNKIHIYYQKVILPVFLLSVASLIFYFVTN